MGVPVVRSLPRCEETQGSMTMTTIDRSSFDAPTLGALDDVARLLHVFNSVLGMNETFKKAGHRGLDASEAKPAAKKILNASKAAAEGLMDAAFDRKREKIELARQRHLTRLQRALEHATELARQEREAISEIGERGVFRQHVEMPLRAITEAWAATAH